MEDSRAKWVVKAAGAGALALMLALPSFAQSRGDSRRGRDDRGDRGRNESSRGNDSRRDDGDWRDHNRDNRDNRDNRTYRDNERVSAHGRVTSFSRERDGYRVHLDRGHESYWVPQSYFRNRGRDLRVGVSIVLGGVFRGGSVYVDDVNWPDDGGYRDGYYGSDYVSGYVQRVDQRRGTAELRDDRSGRIIVVAFRNAGRYERLGVEDLRRGDFVELSGSWARGGVFEAYDIDSIRDGRR